MRGCATCRHGTLVDGLYYRCALQSATPEARATYRTRCNLPGKWAAR